MLSITIRPYAPADYAACLGIFQSNIPTFFTEGEEADFVNWLDSLDNEGLKEDDGEVAHYFVAEMESRVLACGGWGIRAGADHATLIWGAVHRAYHGRGIGDALTRHRLRDFLRSFPEFPITIDTSHLTAPFYERFGFSVEKVTEHGYAPGLHRYDMRLISA